MRLRLSVLLVLLAWSAALAGGCSETPARPTSGVSPARASAATTSDPTATIQATAPNASEAGPVAGAFTVSLSYYGAQPITVTYGVGGTATAGADYTALSGSVTIPAGQAAAQIPVNPIDDTRQEPAETVIVTLTGGTGYAVGSPAAATVTIADNDTPPPKCLCTSVTVEFEPGGNSPQWGTYLVGGNSRWRVGFRINVKCTGTGDSSKCSVFQIENGTLKWTVGGKPGQVTGQSKKVTFHSGKLTDPWEKEYSDALGADYPANTTDSMSVTLDMEFEIKCVSADGSTQSKKFKVMGTVDAQAASKGKQPALSNASITLTPL